MDNHKTTGTKTRYITEVNGEKNAEHHTKGQDKKYRNLKTNTNQRYYGKGERSKMEMGRTPNEKERWKVVKKGHRMDTERQEKIQRKTKT